MKSAYKYNSIVYINNIEYLLDLTLQNHYNCILNTFGYRRRYKFTQKFKLSKF